jgi:EpsD family peptidyl-prolyl cis-trans isomerase
MLSRRGFDHCCEEELMRIHQGAAVACSALLLLGGCDRLGLGGSSEQGPVAVTVDGEKVTVAELDAELAGADVRDPQNPEVRRAVLERIVLRKLMAKEAREKKLGDPATAEHMREAAVENYEASLVQRDALKAVGAPTDGDVQAFMAANPQMFGGRTIYLVERLMLPQRPDAATAAALEPANTFQDIIKVLQDRKVPFRGTREQIDSLRVPPTLANQMETLKPGQPFVLPVQGGVSINRIVGKQAAPVAGDVATQVAREALTNQRRQKAVADRIAAVNKAGEAKVVYAPEYAPPAKAETPPAK